MSFVSLIALKKSKVKNPGRFARGGFVGSFRPGSFRPCFRRGSIRPYQTKRPGTNCARRFIVASSLKQRFKTGRQVLPWHHCVTGPL